jgi:hypothetical protein
MHELVVAVCAVDAHCALATVGKNSCMLSGSACQAYGGFRNTDGLLGWLNKKIRINVAKDEKAWVVIPQCFRSLVFICTGIVRIHTMLRLRQIHDHRAKQ